MARALALPTGPPLLRLSPLRAEERPAVEALAARLRDREEALTDAVLRELLPLLHRWLARLLGPDGELEDAVQDALTAVALALPSFEGRASLGTLAYRIALRVASKRRRRRRITEPLPDEVESPCSGPERQVRARRALARLYRALDGLTEVRRVAFVLVALDGLAPSEAAQVLGVSPVALRSRLLQARRALEAELAADEELRVFLGESP